MSECDEIAANMAQPPRFGNYDEALRYVRQQMPGESEAVIKPHGREPVP